MLQQASSRPLMMKYPRDDKLPAIHSNSSEICSAFALVDHLLQHSKVSLTQLNSVKMLWTQFVSKNLSASTVSCFSLKFFLLKHMGTLTIQKIFSLNGIVKEFGNPTFKRTARRVFEFRIQVRPYT